MYINLQPYYFILINIFNNQHGEFLSGSHKMQYENKLEVQTKIQQIFKRTHLRNHVPQTCSNSTLVV